MKLIIGIAIIVLASCTFISINGDNNVLTDTSREGGLILDK